MFESRVLETAIGLIFVFLLFSTICASIREGIEAFMKTRATYLERGLRELLNDASGQGLTSKLYAHPLIFSLYRGDYPSDGVAGTKGRRAMLPTYIPSKNFALALMDIVARGPTTPAAPAPNGSAISAPTSIDNTSITMDSLRAGARTAEIEPIARAVLSALDIAQGDLDRARLNIEQWYDSTMDRVSGWYRRSTHWIVFSMALVLAGVLNVNSIHIADYLYRNDIPRQHVVKQAEEATKVASAAPPVDSDTKKAPSTSTLFDDEKLQLPIGWDYLSRPNQNASTFEVATFWLTGFAGWIITALAATLGAPFWFDVMNKIMIIRSTVKPHEKSPEEASEDRQQAYEAPRTALPVLQAPTTVPTQSRMERRRTPQLVYNEPVEVDGCGHADAPQTEDKDLPPAQGGIK